MENKIEIFCSGICHNNGNPEVVGSWGAVMRFRQTRKEFKARHYDDFMTNQRAELYACIESLKQLKTDDYPVVVYSSSKYIVDCFEECWYKRWQDNDWKSSGKKPIANKELWWELLALWVWFDPKFEYKSDIDVEMKRAQELAMDIC